jgi:glyoxylase-like metal-dependent hydrolase (beta-lactamase superfamily II)
MSSQSELVHVFFHKQSYTFCYLIVDTKTQVGAIIDPVLDFDYYSGRSSTEFCDNLIKHVKENNISIEWILETHAHADHLSAAPYLKEHVGGKISISCEIPQTQKTFKDIYHLPDSFVPDGRDFDHLFEDKEEFSVGTLQAYAFHTPGHTADSITYVINNSAFIGDTLFMPDAGTARCDFPGGSASILYKSIQEILNLPEETKLYMCHDYGTKQRDVEYLTTVKEQKEKNIHVGGKRKEQEFITIRETRDKTLNMPKLIIPSVQVNIRAGNFPASEENGLCYLKIPINAL